MTSSATTILKRHPFFQPFLVLIVAAGGAALIFSLTRISLHQLDWRFLFMLVAMAAIASRLSIPIPHAKGAVTVGDTLSFLTMLLYDVEAAVLMAARDGSSSASY